MKIINYKIIEMLAFCLLIVGQISAQEDKTDMLNIGLVMPQEGDIPSISAAHISKMETKILGILTNNGVSLQGGGNSIVLYPKLDIYDDQDVNTGMKNLKAVRVTLTLFVKQANENMIFTSESRSLSGSGNTREQALNNAINNINPQDAKWANFTKTTKTKIIQYYQKMCTSISAQAEQLSQTGQNEKALSLLLNVPKEVSCFNDVKTQAIELYKKNMNRQCGKDLQLAKAKIASGDYELALLIIGRIDPESACFSEAAGSMNTVAAKVDEQTRQHWEFLKEAYKNGVELEKLRINAMRDIDVAYWQNRQQAYNYLVLIR